MVIGVRVWECLNVRLKGAQDCGGWLKVFLGGGRWARTRPAREREMSGV